VDRKVRRRQPCCSGHNRYRLRYRGSRRWHGSRYLSVVCSEPGDVGIWVSSKRERALRIETKELIKWLDNSCGPLYSQTAGIVCTCPGWRGEPKLIVGSAARTIQASDRYRLERDSRRIIDIIDDS
jgi:hypothetical protein